MSNVIKLTDPKRARVHARDQANVFLARLDSGASVDDIQQIEN